MPHSPTSAPTVRYLRWVGVAALPFCGVWASGQALFHAFGIGHRYGTIVPLATCLGHLAAVFFVAKVLRTAALPPRPLAALSGGLFLLAFAWVSQLTVASAIALGHWNGLANVDLFADFYRNAWFYLRELVGAEAWQIGLGLLTIAAAFAAVVYAPVRAFVALVRAPTPRWVRWWQIGGAAAAAGMLAYALSRPATQREEIRVGFLLRDPVGYFYYDALVRGRIHRRVRAAQARQAVVLDSLAAAVPPPPRPLPNVVLVTIDALTRDFVGAYGAPASVTPVIDELVARGPHVLVAEGMANYNSSGGGILSIQQGHFLGDELRRFPSIADYLHAFGYQTAFLLGGNHTAYYGLTRFYGDNVDYLRQAASVEGYGDTDDRAVVEALRQYLRDGYDARAPQYLNLHLMSAHETRKLFDRRAVPPEAVAHLRARLPATEETATDYLLGVAQADAVLGTLLHVLDSAGVLDDALVVVTSDHGEGFLPGGRREHGGAYSPSQYAVPIILAGEVLRGRRDTVAVGSQIDIAPTVAESVGLPPHPAWLGTSLLDVADTRVIPYNTPSEDFSRVRFHSPVADVTVAFPKPVRGTDRVEVGGARGPWVIDVGGGDEVGALPDSALLARARAMLAQ